MVNAPVVRSAFVVPKTVIPSIAYTFTVLPAKAVPSILD